LKSIFGTDNNIEFSCGSKLEAGYDAYFFIEEFSKKRHRTQIKNLRKNSLSKFILIPSEFVTTSKKLSTFNDFSGANHFYLRVFSRPFCNLFFTKITVGLFIDFLRAAFYLPFFIWWLLLNITNTNLQQTYIKIRGILYFDIRYLTFLEMLDSFDFVWSPHKEIQKNARNYFRPTQILPVIEPIITSTIGHQSLDNKTKQITFKMSGNITSFRLEQLAIFKTWCKRILPNDTKFYVQGFSNSPEMNFDFTFNPPQSEKWQFSSPMRIFRSFEVEKCIPFVIKNSNRAI
jgi:hypothetical protein